MEMPMIDSSTSNTLLDAIVASLRDAARFNPDDQVAPDGCPLDGLRSPMGTAYSAITGTVARATGLGRR